MTSPDRIPPEIQINAWTGAPARSATDESFVRWGFRPQGQPAAEWLLPALPLDLARWEHPEVGWGLVLPDADDLDDETRVSGDDAPEPIRRLLAARPGCPVLRYRPELVNSHLRRYYRDRGAQDIALSASERGIAPGRLPRYLLVYGGPERVPWRLQFLLNQSAAVGRLTLEGAALDNYVNALLDDWKDSEAHVTHAVVWSVDHGPDDITHLMRRLIAEKVVEDFKRDTVDLGPGTAYLYEGSGGATLAALATTLAEQRPSLIVTTSHGMTGPLDDSVATLRNLGLLVDDGFDMLDPARLLAEWQPDGAIWYAHACCSAGSNAPTAFDELVPEDTPVDKVLRGVAAIGAHVSPLPTALLGAASPLRAFVGHVEPTFDWTLRHPSTGQSLTASIRQALTSELYAPAPLGHALREPYRHVGELLGQRDQAYNDYNKGAGGRDVAVAAQLAALDRASMVILGDPTVVLPVRR